MRTATMTLAGMARRCTLIAVRSQFELNAGIAACAKVIYGHAYRVIGDDEKLTPLADSTIERKERAGYAEPEAPLVATGEMQSDMEWMSAGPLAGVGNENVKMLWHHIGGRNYPPRPALNIAVAEARDECWLIAREFAARAVGLGGRTPRLRDIIPLTSRVRIGKPTIGSDIR